MSGKNIVNVALTGACAACASGHSGKFIAAALLKPGKHEVTALSRKESKSTFPDGIKVTRVNYDDHAELVEALIGHDALVITLSGTAPHSQQEKLIKAAADADIRWIFPNEWSPDSDSRALHKDLTMIWQPSQDARDLIDSLGKSSWVAVVTGFWYEWSLAIPLAYGFDIVNRSATLLDGGSVPITTTTWPQVGRTVAILLSLPIEDDGSNGLCLSEFRNRHVYVSSFTLTQNEMFESLLRVTGTDKADWKVSNSTAELKWTSGRSRFEKGDRTGFIDWLYGRVMSPDGAGNHAGTRQLSDGMLGLPKEDLDQHTRIAVERAETGRMFSH